MKRKIIGAVMIVMLALGMVACSSKDNNATNNNTTTTASGGDAAKLFGAKCSVCHGKDLGGLNGPNLQKIGSKYSKDQILDIIKNGKGNGAMPAGVYSGKDAEAVATWLSNKK